jgi:hypothetical protein
MNILWNWRCPMFLILSRLLFFKCPWISSSEVNLQYCNDQATAGGREQEKNVRMSLYLLISSLIHSRTALLATLATVFARTGYVFPWSMVVQSMICTLSLLLCNARNPIIDLPLGEDSYSPFIVIFGWILCHISVHIACMSHFLITTFNRW